MSYATEPVCIDVRRMLPKHYAIVADLAQECFGGTTSAEEVAEAMEAEGAVGRMAFLREVAVGFILWREAYDYFWIAGIGVAKGYRRQQIASRLLRGVLTRARGDVRRIGTAVNEYNLVGQLFLRDRYFECCLKRSALDRYPLPDLYFFERRLDYPIGDQ